jgi:5-methylcytosine-specific restriction protein A
MPHKPLHPCNAPGCSELVPSGRCAKHRREHQQRLDNPWTATREREFYWSTRWRKTRARFMAATPFCVDCAAENHVAAAQEVDHIVPLVEHGDPYNWENLRSLCSTHHRRRTRNYQNAKAQKEKQ